MAKERLQRHLDRALLCLFGSTLLPIGDNVRAMAPEPPHPASKRQKRIKQVIIRISFDFTNFIHNCP